LPKPFLGKHNFTAFNIKFTHTRSATCAPARAAFRRLQLQLLPLLDRSDEWHADETVVKIGGVNITSGLSNYLYDFRTTFFIFTVPISLLNWLLSDTEIIIPYFTCLHNQRLFYIAGKISS